MVLSSDSSNSWELALDLLPCFSLTAFNFNHIHTTLPRFQLWPWPTDLLPVFEALSGQYVQFYNLHVDKLYLDLLLVHIFSIEIWNFLHNFAAHFNFHIQWQWPWPSDQLLFLMLNPWNFHHMYSFVCITLTTAVEPSYFLNEARE